MEWNFDKDREIQKFWTEGMNYFDREEAIMASVDRAALDFTARTETKKENAGEENLSTRLKRPSEENLVKRLADYFQNPPVSQTAFNIWHHSVCLWILAVENEMYDNVSYGKAQKVLNMTFKNLYCTAFGQEKEKENENFFKFCHMPLDRFTLEWIFRNIYPCYKDLKRDRLCKTKTPAWSKFTYEGEYDSKGKLVFYSYPYISELVADYFKKYKQEITAFQAEFVIWKEMPLEMTAETFYAQAYDYLEETKQQKHAPDFHEKPLDDKLKKVCYLLQKHYQ